MRPYTIEQDPIYGKTSRFADPAEELQAVEQASELVKEYALTAEMLPPETMSRGNQGDEPSYTRVINLKGAYPGDEALRRISTLISNTIPVNRVTFEIGSKNPPL